MRHVLIDVGNVLGDPKHNSEVFRSIFDDINRRLDRRPIDLYVMTHEHMDHVQGLLRASSEGIQLRAIDYAWLTASSSETYYEQFPQAIKQRSLRLASYDRVRGIAQQRGILGLASVQAFLENNDPRRTEDCVKFLRGVARAYKLCRSRIQACGRRDSSVSGGRVFDLGAGARHLVVLRSHAASDAKEARAKTDRASRREPGCV
jgi:hypothetical protein